MATDTDHCRVNLWCYLTCLVNLCPTDWHLYMLFEVSGLSVWKRAAGTDQHGNWGHRVVSVPFILLYLSWVTRSRPWGQLTEKLVGIWSMPWGQPAEQN